MNEQFHTEMIDLPSKGWFYPLGHPLASGQIELRYMTAAHEDILTSRNLIQKGVVIDKLLEALIVNPAVKMDDVLLGDKSAIMIASRILGYGKEYSVTIQCPDCSTKNEMVVDLQDIPTKESPLFISEYRNVNSFPFQLPVTKKTVMFKFLTHGDERSVTVELEGMRKAMRSDVSREVTARLRRSILSIDGESDGEKIRRFIEEMPARDAIALREHVRAVGPDIDLTTWFLCSTCNYEGRVDIPIDVTFFWPNVRV